MSKFASLAFNLSLRSNTGASLMSRTTVVSSVCLAMLVSSIWTTAAHGVSIQFDFGNNQGSFDNSTNSPAHDLGFLGSNDNRWNTVNGDASTGLVFSDGTPATGVSIDTGRQEFASGAINFAQNPSTFGTGLTGFYDNALLEDWLSTIGDDNIGVRVSGLPAGHYRVFGIVREGDAPTRTYSAAIGVNGSLYDDDAGQVSPGFDVLVGTAGAPADWVSGQNFFTSGVTITDPSDFIVFILDPTNTQFASLNGLQLVAIPEPSTGLLLSFGLFGLVRRRRNRR